MSEISLFPYYKQPENQVTNYCLRIIRLLYEEHHRFFYSFLDVLTDGEIDKQSFPAQFEQQVKGSRRVIDGKIRQEPFTIGIETKTGGPFNIKQLKDHWLDMVEEGKDALNLLIALGTEDMVADSVAEKFEQAIKKDFKRVKDTNYFFRLIAFRDFVDAFRKIDLPESMETFVDEFEEYLLRKKLLDSWKEKMWIVACNDSYDFNIENKVYICPAKGGNYSFSRAKWFGIYKQKKVHYVAEIAAVVDVFQNEEFEIYWSNCEINENDLRKRAYSLAKEDNCFNKRSPKSKFDGWRVFLFDDMEKTNFKKDSPGPIPQRRKHDVSQFSAKSTKELAEKLREEKW